MDLSDEVRVLTETNMVKSLMKDVIENIALGKVKLEDTDLDREFYAWLVERSNERNGSSILH